MIADRAGHLSVYLERLTAMDGAIARGSGKRLDRGKIGQQLLLAYDESKKTLAVVASDKVRLRSRYNLVFLTIVTVTAALFCIR